MLRRIAVVVSLASGMGSALPAQQLASRQSTLSDPPPAAARATAVRASSRPVLDGRDTDDVWKAAQEISAFRIYDPVEDGEPTMRTTARVAYDDRNLYILVRAYDPRPDSIVSLLSRRDVRTASDQIKVVVDSYFDRRTGYEFAVNPVGVKRDYYVFNDVEEDESWDGVWEAKTSVDSLGWVAEFRIPFSQLRFPKREVHTFGVGVYRDIARSNERVSWPLLRRSKFGFSSQLGEVAGIRGIDTPRRLELLPYTVQKNLSRPDGNEYSREQQMTVGADLKYGVTSNLTLDATVNPDFGQVEADPAVFNLTALEQFFGERRPFFLEGTGIFRFDMSCSDNVCQGLFYSRRIGRTPQLGFLASDQRDLPAASTILGAAKLTGRLHSGLSVGFLDAVTQRETVGDVVVEPQTNYFVGRLQQDFRKGTSSVGLMVTGANRQLDAATADYLRREGYAAGIDFRHRFYGRYQLGGFVTASTVRGEPRAIARTQRSSVHNYQRPDDALRYDTTRTALSGAAFQLGLNKLGGDITRFWTGYTRYSPGFDINDVGFLPRADNQGYSNWFALVFNTPRAFYRRLQVNLNEWQNWTIGGMRTSLGGNINANTTLRNQWFVYGGVGWNFGSNCVLCTRGGPALRQSDELNSWFGVNGDNRLSVYPGINLSYNRGDEGRSFSYSVGPSVTARVASRFSMTVGPSFSRNVDDQQWVANFGVSGSDTTHYTVAHLEQKTTSLTGRMDFTMTPTLSLQVYAQPFMTSGRYANWRELNEPRAASYERRYKPFVGTEPLASYNFNSKQFNSNTVLRWEYRPGSTLFVVWAQGRQQSDLDRGTFEFGRDFSNLFAAHPNNTFLVKASYWFSL